MSSQPWYQTFFGEDYLQIYSPFLPASRTQHEVSAIEALLHLTPGMRILDVCCGDGRHALPLAQRGYAVTGLDLSAALLDRARQETARLHLNIDWLQQDMRSIPYEDTFDAAINIFTSFGYFEQEEDDLLVLKEIHKALAPGGIFLLETVYQPRVVRAFTPQSMIRYDNGLIVMEEREIDLLKSRNNVRITLLHPNGERIEHRQSIRIYTLTELISLINQAGLQVTGYYGDLDGNALTLDSRLVIVSQKPTPSQ
ncbi:methyltransferase type 11 [Ktedonobacter sp. SOSP1-85]|uniref:class I SAM-dependent methyltransferase n=1 Tax=unclassified Ktedonobacter TaxID=388461 RepID=UPI00191606A6|nr:MULTISPECIES: class I SAM-dependent methyltransferase [unclassified Ktedonobacter]GHO67637.1 methyltransferase type 11 [Ktedonobacter sp. SOSP1-52]GHO73074.1 methyltransferase type 11 [Ktedonobacter sp. SOSP1-85]